MSVKNNKTFSKDEIENAIKNTPTMGGAAKFLKIDWRTFKKEAEKYNLYTPIITNKINEKFELKDILGGKYPQYPTSKLSKRLVKENYKEYKCEICGIDSWQNNPISLELNHIDGDNGNHLYKNLQLLCPNCHSQTENYRSKKLKIKK